MNNVLFIITALATVVGFSFYITAFVSAYKERKITTNFIEKLLIGSSMFGVASVFLMTFFQRPEGLYTLVAMALSVVLLVAMYPKIKEAN